MDDNSRPHRARLVNEYLQSENIRKMDWPARTPDLNPIEHVWDALGRRIGARVKPFKIYSRMKVVYGYKCLYQNRIFEWFGKFKSCIENLDDAPRPGAPVKVSDDATT
ncbi:hypothetical protein LAZ67_20002009 [Cordylochernes scorpioides]|uniref:Tc1-like transposase DDE domain-containing protein n=1 Tax=Cordylochernes scorpioides TaxID=51811 RepID=A0ABY6LM60_9ARAC|nr:hypothetical protein LAZ67_20002009 [Cordylochernes scorpioides]